ncbi:hypothetical protein [Streptomyces sp. NBC_00078]|uniref:hypothetical protein n=1 Tax=Streptomyces sp. NBC_00078 TaxID=2975643 RepID=UPI002257E69B|nr:hypothetical protein [Streptomyces sp. NBC_00078]MCX5426115.1 hypothetical protein [Streptomyces sp. NBC_00078]
MSTNPDGQQIPPAALDLLRELASMGRKDGVRLEPGFELNPDSGQQYRTVAELETAAGAALSTRTVKEHLPHLRDAGRIRS